jgi:hypothetical protein
MRKSANFSVDDPPLITRIEPKPEPDEESVITVRSSDIDQNVRLPSTNSLSDQSVSIANIPRHHSLSIEESAVQSNCLLHAEILAILITRMSPAAKTICGDPTCRVNAVNRPMSSKIKVLRL